MTILDAEIWFWSPRGMLRAHPEESSTRYIKVEDAEKLLDEVATIERRRVHDNEPQRCAVQVADTVRTGRCCLPLGHLGAHR